PHFQWPWHWPVIPQPGPGPAPKPTPAPIPVSGLHVLVVTDRTTALTPAQQLALSSGDVRSYLNQTCPAGPSGQKEWRFLDKSADLTNESPLWQEAFKRTSGKPVPYIIVSNPDKGVALRVRCLLMLPLFWPFLRSMEDKCALTK